MFEHLIDYQAAKPELWQGRSDTPDGGRFFQKIQCISDPHELAKHKKATVFLGFSSDAGVIRNKGRAGSRLGPDQLKTQLAKLPCPMDNYFIDLGSIACKDDALESAQSQFGELIDLCHHYGHHTVALGGGHEMAWGHYQGLARHYPKIGIINFDAHFDLRPYQHGELGTSGTPFSQIAAFCAEKSRPFHYCCLGIQPFGNTPNLFHRAQELNVSYLSAEDMQKRPFSWQTAFLDEFMLNLDNIYLTLCLDVLAECYAPGVSAPQPLGLTPWQILPLLKYIIQSGKVVSMDVAELAPPHDPEQKTARLASFIIAELLNTH